MTQWDFQNKGILTSPARLPFVLKVPLCHLRPSVIYSVPCDRILQRAYYSIKMAQFETIVQPKEKCHILYQAKYTFPGKQLSYGALTFLFPQYQNSNFHNVFVSVNGTAPRLVSLVQFKFVKESVTWLPW